MSLRRSSALGGIAAALLLGALTHADARTLHLNVSVGEEVRVFGHVRFGENCENGPVPDMAVTREPAHGKVEARDEPVTLTSAASGSSKCSGRTAPGKVIYYKRLSAGPDHLEYDIFSPGLPTTNWKVTLGGN